MFLVRIYTFCITTLLALAGCHITPASQHSEPAYSIRSDTSVYALPDSTPNEAFSHPAFRAVDSLNKQLMKGWQLEGVTLAVARHGKLVYAQGYGHADRQKKLPAQAWHPFRLASISKLITAAAVMKLVEEGRLSLHDKVFGQQGILNDSVFLNARDARVYSIEVKHLLQHTSGWRNVFRADPMFLPTEVARYMKVKAPPGLKNTIRFMLGQEMLAEPGEVFDYSNFGYALLGLVVERRSGIRYEEYVNQHFLAPLHIKNMYMASNVAEHGNSEIVQYYDYTETARKPAINGSGKLASRAYEGMDIAALGAAGAWVANAPDLLLLTLTLDGQGGVPDRLGQQALEWMMHGTDSAASYPMGWRYCNEHICVRTGSMSGTVAVLSMQKDGTSWVWLSNTGTWRGPYFYKEVMEMMEKALATLNDWPERNFFPVHISTDTLWHTRHP